MKTPSLKPRVPEHHIFDEGLYKDLFLGDEAAGRNATAAVLEGTARPGGGIYVIVGPPRTGKETAFQNVARKVRASDVPVFDTLDSKKTRVDARKPYGHLRKAGGNLIRLETDIETESLPREIADARAVLREFPDSTIVIDALRNEPRIPVRAPGRWPRKAANDKSMLDTIEATNPDVVFLHTAHDLETVRTGLWRLNETLAQDYSHTGNAIRTQILDGQRGPDVDAIVKALNDCDRTAYDDAFDRIAAHMAGHNNHAPQASARRTGMRL